MATVKDYEKLLRKAKDGDCIGVGINPGFNGKFDAAGNLIQSQGADIAHMEFIYNAKKRIAITADGAAGFVKVDSLERYKYDNIEGVTFYLLRHKDRFTQGEIDKMKSFAMKRAKAKIKYGWGLIAVVARKTFMCSIPMFGFFINKATWTTPPFNKIPSEETFCSRECVLTIRQVRPKFMEKYWIDYCIPHLVFNSDDLEIIYRAG